MFYPKTTHRTPITHTNPPADVNTTIFTLPSSATSLRIHPYRFSSHFLSPLSTIFIFPVPPTKIRRPMNAFMLFANANRKRMAEIHPDESNKDISKRLGITWRSLNVVDKAKYFEVARLIDGEHKKKYPREWVRKTHTTCTHDVRMDSLVTNESLLERLLGPDIFYLPLRLSSNPTDTYIMIFVSCRFFLKKSGSAN